MNTHVNSYLEFHFFFSDVKKERKINKWKVGRPLFLSHVVRMVYLFIFFLCRRNVIVPERWMKLCLAWNVYGQPVYLPVCLPTSSRAHAQFRMHSIRVHYLGMPYFSFQFACIRFQSSRILRYLSVWICWNYWVYRTARKLKFDLEILNDLAWIQRRKFYNERKCFFFALTGDYWTSSIKFIAPLMSLNNCVLFNIKRY